MRKTKTIALTGMLALAGFGFACSSGVGEKGNTNAAKPTTSATNTPAPTNASTAPTTSAVAGLDAAGAATYTAKCAGCHGPDAKGTKGAPDIFAVKAKHTSAEWQAYLKDTKIWEKDNKMPVIPLDEAQLKQLGDWLAAETGKGGAPGAMPENKAEAGKTEAGKAENAKKP